MELVECICGSILNAQEISEHIKTFHINKFEITPDFSSLEVREFFQNLFPDYKIHMQSGSGNYALYSITLTKGEVCIEQRLGNTQINHRYPQTLEDAAAEVIDRVHVIQYITSRLLKIGNFRTLYCHRFQYGYRPSESRYVFSYAPEQGSSEELLNDSFYPHKHQDDEDQKQYLEDFILNYRQYFVSELEGILESVNHDGYFEGYSINGISCNHLLFSNDEVRLEIID